jgi:hypothetical protein
MQNRKRDAKLRVNLPMKNRGTSRLPVPRGGFFDDGSGWTAWL